MKKIVLVLTLFFCVTITFYQAYGNEITLEYLMKQNEALQARLVELERRQRQENEELREKVSYLEKKIAAQALEGPEREAGKEITGKKGWEEYVPGFPKVVLVEQTITEKETGNMKGWVPHLPRKPVVAKPPDIAFKPYATLIVQGAPDPNLAGNGKFDGSYKTDLDIEKQFGDWGLAFLELEVGQGVGVMDELGVFSNVDNNADDTNTRAIMNKFWYEQYLFDKQLAVLCGKLSASDWIDQNKYAADDSCQFLGEIFNNSPVIEWPASNSFGAYARLCVEKLKFLVFGLGYFDGTGDWRNLMDHGVYMARVNVKPADLLEMDPAQWEGNYRFYWWMNTRNHTKLQAPGATREKNYGFGLSWDQMITDVFGLFGRFGWQRPDLIPVSGAKSGATLEWSWQFGAQMDGDYWGREYDTLGVAVGQIAPSRDYRDAGFAARTEGHVEMYYKYQLNKHLGISPDFQIIWNPDGEGDDDNPIFVYGVRSHLNF